MDGISNAHRSSSIVERWHCVHARVAFISSTDRPGYAMVFMRLIQSFYAPRGLPWDLDTAEAICKALPNPPTRRAFIGSLYLPEPKASEKNFRKFGRLAPAVHKLNEAYQAGPQRKDWTRLLEQLRLYPKITH